MNSTVEGHRMRKSESHEICDCSDLGGGVGCQQKSGVSERECIERQEQKGRREQIQ